MVRCSKCINLFFVLAIIFSSLSCKKAEAPTDAPAIITKIIGTVSNKVTSALLQGVQITSSPVTSTITTDANGKYEFDKVTAGSYVITAVKAGYKDSQINVTVSEGNTATADIQLEEKTSELEITPSYVDFSTAETKITISINNKSGIGSLNFNLAKTASWLTLSESAGSITNNIKYIDLTVDRSQVGYGSYNDVITVTSNGGNTSISVQMVKQNPNSPQLTVTPVLVDFGGTKTETNVILSNTGTGAIIWSATTSDSWISTNYASGELSTNTTTVTIKVNRSSLSPGNYNGTVQFASNGGNQTVTVKMSVPAVPVLSITQRSFDFGQTTTSQTFVVNNIGTGTLTWNIVSDKPWLTVSPAQGTNYTSTTISVNRSGYTTGTYTGKLSITSNGGSDQVDVTMEVPPPAPPPSVVLATPENITAYSCDLRWQQSTLSANDFSSYKIYYDTQSNVTEQSTLVTTITNSDTRTKNITGLKGNTKYYFRIYVVNSVGGSAGSNIVNATTEIQLGTWSVAITLTGVNPTANCLFPVSETDVWAVGDEIWHYNGTTWIKDLKPSGIGKLYGVYFTSASEGWAVGANATVIHYNGSTWEKVTSSVFPTSSNAFYDVVLTSGSDVWVSGFGAFYHYDGNSWIKLTTYSFYIYDMDILNKNEIYASSAYKLLKYNG